MAPATREADVPGEFNTGFDEAGVPQRELSEFTVLRAGKLVSVCELDEPRAAVGMRVSGRLGGREGAGLRTESADLTEMCIEYSNDPQLWVRSETAWYKLGRPAAEYARTHDLALRRFELCSRIYIIVTSFPSDQASFKAVVGYLASPWSNMRGYREKEILAEKEFILAQMEELDQAVLNESMFLRELRGKKAGGGGSGGTPKGGSTKIVKKKKPVASSSSSPPGGGSGGGSGGLPPKAIEPWVPRTEGMDPTTQLKLVKRMTKAVSAAMKMKKAGPFLRPVIPETDGCPDYLDRIKTPMDYGTIWERLDKGGFYSSANEVAQHVRLVRQNCVQYNGPDHQFSKYAAEVERKFDKEARAAEESELKAMQKRLNPAANGSGTTADKKRKAAAAADGDTGSEGAIAPTGRKPPASGKGRGKKSGASSPGAVDGQECISTATGAACGKRARPGSRYCGDECGMAVARKKLRVLIAEGNDIDAYVQRSLGTALVRTNPLNA